MEERDGLFFVGGFYNNTYIYVYVYMYICILFIRTRGVMRLTSLYLWVCEVSFRYKVVSFIPYGGFSYRKVSRFYSMFAHGFPIHIRLSVCNGEI
jgi:hypothetical protein